MPLSEYQSKYFLAEDFACPCGCGSRELDSRIWPALDRLQRLAGPHKVSVVLGLRCEKENKRAKGVSKLAHMDGRAVDVRIADLTLDEMYKLALQVEAFREGGIGLNDDGSMHLDVRVFPARWGRVNGQYLGIAASKLLGRHPSPE